MFKDTLVNTFSQIKSGLKVSKNTEVNIQRDKI